MKWSRRSFFLFILLLLFSSLKSDAEENLPAQVEDGNVQESNSAEVTAKQQDTKTDESNSPCESSDEKNENSELGKQDKVEPSSCEEQNLDSNSEETNDQQQISNSKLKTETADECEQQPGSHAEKSEEVKKEEESDNPPVAVDVSKQKAKEDENTRKTSLSDVNSQAEDEGRAKSAKRETSRESPSFHLGLPRDASYFFDDLEPFINISESGRVGRAAPARDRNQKSKLNGKGKDLLEDDVDEDEEEKNEEDEKQDEDEYDDDDEDVETDCKPTKGCPTTCATTPKCTTTTPCPTTPTPCPTTTTPCPPPTTKCTTKRQCPSTCKTSPQCTTKCPKLCAKADQKLETNLRKESDISWNGGKKKHRHGKRRLNSKE